MVDPSYTHAHVKLYACCEPDINMDYWIKTSIVIGSTVCRGAI